MDALHCVHKGHLSHTESLRESFRELLGHLSVEEISRNRQLMDKASEVGRSLDRLQEGVCAR